MQIEDLRLFTHVAQSGSLSAAARQLDLTPAAVSACIKRIESHLGVRLIERTTRSLRLTAEGERFLQTCDSMLLTWGRGQAVLHQSARAVEGHIHLAAPSDTSLQFLTGWVGEYTAAHPRVQVTLHVGDRMHDVTREAVDIAIRYGDLEDSSMIGRLLCRSERVLVAAPGYVKRFGAPKSPDDLLEHRCLAWLMREQPKSQWTFGLPAGSTHTVVIRPALCGDGALVRAWALQGEGVAYKAMIDVAADLRARRLVRLLPDHAGEPVPVSALMPSGRYRPARVRDLLAFLTERFRAL